MPKSYKEPCFQWRREWYEYMEEHILSTPEKLNFYRSVAAYGLYGKDLNLLCCEDADYFNTIIKPDLDRQRKRLKLA